MLESSNTIYEKVRQEPLVQVVQRRQLRFIGHCLRRNPNELMNTYALYTPKPGHIERKRGRPRLNYSDYIARLINNRPDPEECCRKKSWHNMVFPCKPRLFAVEW